MKVFFLAVFLISTSIHLYASSKKNGKLRSITKPFILSSLLGFYCFAAHNVLVVIVLALLFSWLGDVFLIPKGVKWFSLGGTSFIVSHVCFILGYSQDIDFSRLNTAAGILLALLFAGAVCFIFSKLRSHLPKALIFPMFLYLLLNGAMNCFAVFRLMSAPCAASFITCIGALLFFISDVSLFFVRFKRNSRFKTHFLVMLTYSAGEFLIILGLL